MNEPRKIRRALSFDDVLLVPKHNTVESRSNVTLETYIGSFVLDSPIISANMPSVTGPDMSLALSAHGALGIIHRMCSVDEQAEMVRKSVVKNPKCVGGAVSAAINIGKE